MNLRDQLKDILPDILPRNPAKAIKGTELIESVRDKLQSNYSDATLRYHFSIMSCDPSSPIAKVEQGQGYYLRSTTIHTINSARNMISNEQANGLASDADISISRANKFRAVVQRYLESRQELPFAFERSFSNESAGGTRWQVPDVTSVKWTVADQAEDGTMVLNREKLEVQRRMGEAPFQLTNTKLRLDISADNVLENLFQTLSASRWANTSELMVAAPITDPVVLEEMRNFASEYGVGVTTFNMDGDMIDDLPEPAAVKNLSASEFEQILSLFNVQRVTSPSSTKSYDWQAISAFAQTSEDFAQFQAWINASLINESITGLQQFIDQHQPRREEAVA